MKQNILTTYHFTDDHEGPEEYGLRRNLRDIVGMLSMEHNVPEGVDRRVVMVMVQSNGFTADQFARFCDIITAVIAAKRATIANLQKDAEQFNYEALKVYWPDRLKELEQIEKRWLETHAGILEAMASARVERITGLDNHEERAAAARAKMVAA